MDGGKLRAHSVELRVFHRFSTGYPQVINRQRCESLGGGDGQAEGDSAARRLLWGKRPRMAAGWACKKRAKDGRWVGAILATCRAAPCKPRANACTTQLIQ